MTSLLAAARAYTGYIQAFSPGARLFLAAAALGGLDAGVSSILLNLYVLSLGYDPAGLGALLSFGQLMAIPGALAAGPLVDIWGARRAMLAGTALVGAGALALLSGPTEMALRLGLTGTNLGGVVVLVAVPPFLVRHSSPRERSYLFAATAAAYVISTAAGKLLGVWLPVWLGALNEVAAGAVAPEIYRLALFGGALASALGIPLLFAIRETPPGVARATRASDVAQIAGATGVASSGNDGTAGNDGSDGHGTSDANRGLTAAGYSLAAMRLLLATPRVIWLLAQFTIADVLIRFGGNLVLPYLNVLFIRHLGASEAWYGTLAVIERMCVVAGTLLAAPLATRFGPVATIAGTQLLDIPFLLGIGFAANLMLASAALPLRGTLMEMTVPLRDNFLMEVMPASVRATAGALLMLAGYVAGAAGARLGGILAGRDAYPLAFSITAALYAASAVLYWWWFHRRPEAAPGQSARFPLPGA